MVKRRGDQAGVRVYPHRFRHHFSHTWLERGGAEGDLMELNGWSSPQMLQRYGGSARGARARRHYDLIMSGLTPGCACHRHRGVRCLPHAVQVLPVPAREFPGPLRRRVLRIECFRQRSAARWCAW